VAAALAAAVIAALVAACSPALTSAPVTPVAPAVEPTPVPVPKQPRLASATLPSFTAVEVTLGIYSGRPDPSWKLTKDEADKLAALVAALPVVQGGPQQGGLGYHGFLIAMTTPDGSITAVTAYAKAVFPADRGGASRWQDDAGLVERFLLETGKPSLAAAEYAIAKQALGDLLH
jgi:hypothetical protein